METKLSDIYTAGDCVETWHRLLNRYAYMPLGTTSHKQGHMAAGNALGCEVLMIDDLSYTGASAIQLSWA
jgi:NADPH-dependent 2,4-dienoyl-CoA reductase/sulfur reductase-like enzyme